MMMKRWAMFSVAILVGLSFLGRPAAVTAESHGQHQAAQGQGPHSALKTIDESGRMRISEQDRCPVCGMFPAKRPKHAAAMVLKDGRTFYFCSNGCLLRTWRDCDRRLRVPAESIGRMVVQDYFSGAPLDADKAWWVAGSDVVGPMGPALVALRSEQEVTQFRKRHGGRQAFQLSQMDDALWAALFPPKQKKHK
jgi:nitrous oxide reductase accessory protein NosL